MTLTYSIGGVTISGSAHFVDTDSVTLTDAIGQRNTLTFRVISPDGSYKPAIGAAVTVTDDLSVVRFGGNIRQLSTTQRGASLVSEIGCASWESLFDRRPTGVRSYTNQTAGDIFSDLLANCMGSEGLTASVVVAGPTLPSFECDFASVREAFDTICALASDDANTYMWDCTPTKVTRFYRSDSFHAPFDITSSSTDVLQLGGSSRIAASWSLDKYTNRLFVRMGKLTRPEETQSFAIGSDTVFTLDFPVAVVPTIKVDGVDKTVGILDVDSGKDWYWQAGNPNITRDAGGSGGTTLDVTYQGQESIVVGPFENAAEVAARATAEGNLGYYVTILDSDVPGTAADAATRAQAWLDKYSQIPCTVNYPTLRGDLRAGMWQDIYWPEIDVDVRTLLESVTMTQVNGTYLWTVKAIAGALTGDYKMRLRELRGAGGSTSGTPGAPGAPGTPGTPGAGDVPPLLPTAVSASDHPADRVTSLGRVVSTPVHVSVTLPTSHGAEWLNLWIEDGHTGEVIDLGKFDLADPIIIWRHPGEVDFTGNIVKATTGKTGAENPLSTAAASSPFTIGKLATPAASSGITATVGAFTTIQRRDGTYYGKIPEVTYTDPTGTNTDFFVRVNIRELAPDGSVISSQKPYGGTMITGAGDSHTEPPLLITLRPGLGGIQYLFYLANRASQNAGDFADTTTNTLQSVAWNGGSPADHYDVMFGTLPPDAIPAESLSLGDNMGADASGDIIYLGDGDNLIPNGNFDNGSQGWSTRYGLLNIYAYGGAMTPPNIAQIFESSSGGFAGIYETASHPCKVGDQIYTAAYFAGAADNSGTLYYEVWWYDSAVNVWTVPLSASTVATRSGSTPVWTKLSGVVTAPAGAAAWRIVLSIGGLGASQCWNVDNVFAARQTTSDTLSDLAVTAAKLADGAVESAKILDGALNTMAKFAATVKPCAIYTADPALPNAAYPVGTYGFNTTTRVYQRVNAAGNGWEPAVNGGADIQLGTVKADRLITSELNAAIAAFGYVTTTYLSANYASISYLSANYVSAATIAATYVTAGTVAATYATISALNAKTITANNITGGTCSATVSFTAPTINIVNGTVTITLSGAAVSGLPGVSIVNTATNRTTKLLSEGMQVVNNFPGVGSIAGTYEENAVFTYPGGYSSSIDAFGVVVNGVRVVNACHSTRPVTLADVINIGVVKGWWV